jgi:hypothetical protein
MNVVVVGECALNPNVPATAVVSLSFELVTQMAAPGFDPEFNLHGALAVTGSSECVWKSHGRTST